MSMTKRELLAALADYPDEDPVFIVTDVQSVGHALSVAGGAEGDVDFNVDKVQVELASHRGPRAIQIVASFA